MTKFAEGGGRGSLSSTRVHSPSFRFEAPELLTPPPPVTFAIEIAASIVPVPVICLRYLVNWVHYAHFPSLFSARGRSQCGEWHFGHTLGFRGPLAYQVWPFGCLIIILIMMQVNGYVGNGSASY